jgi:hypothetical protein
MHQVMQRGEIRAGLASTVIRAPKSGTEKHVRLRPLGETNADFLAARLMPLKPGLSYAPLLIAPECIPVKTLHEKSQYSVKNHEQK